MKVVRKGKCEPKPVTMKAMDIAMDTVFSGDPINGVNYDGGVFIRCYDGFLRLAYDSGKDPHGYMFPEDATVANYKELNAYLCIEE